VRQRCTHDEDKREHYEKIREGNCLKPLKELFLNLQTWTESLIEGPPQYQSFKLYPLEFETINVSFEENSLKIVQRFCVSGYANALTAQKTGWRTVVGLEILEHKFGWLQLSLLPYIFMHEIICHALQSLDGQNRPNAASSDSWSEGWMDALAHDLVCEWLEQHDRILFTTNAERQDAKLRTAELHQARYGVRVTEGTPHPREGRDAYHNVRGIYPRNWTVPASRHPVTRLSLLLNALTIDATDRIALYEKLNDIAQRDSNALRQMIGSVVAENNPLEAWDRLKRMPA